MEDGELGTELSLLPKNRSASGEVDSAGAFRYITQYRWLDMEKYKVSWALSLSRKSQLLILQMQQSRHKLHTVKKAEIMPNPTESAKISPKVHNVNHSKAHYNAVQ